MLKRVESLVERPASLTPYSITPRTPDRSNGRSFSLSQSVLTTRTYSPTAALSRSMTESKSARTLKTFLKSSSAPASSE